MRGKRGRVRGRNVEELIAEAVIYLVSLLFEFALPLFGDVLAELGIRALGESFQSHREHNAFLAALGYAIGGAILGALSLAAFPRSFIKGPILSIVNLIASPISAGLLMYQWGKYRQSRGEYPSARAGFVYGFVFAVAFGLIRFAYAGR